MQRVTNCILINNEELLLLKKPRRGWYAIPGGKMEQGETIKEGAVREFKEETGLQVVAPKLAGVFTFLIYNDKRELVREWMMFTFVSNSYRGTIASYCDEGELEWIKQEQIMNIPMAEGDKQIFEHVLSSEEIMYAAFSYTEDYKLLQYRLNSTNN